MTDTDALFVVVMAGWCTWSLACAVVRLCRIADALERLVALAERGRR